MLMRQRNILHFKKYSAGTSPGTLYARTDAPARDYRAVLFHKRNVFFGIRVLVLLRRWLQMPMLK